MKFSARYGTRIAGHALMLPAQILSSFNRRRSPPACGLRRGERHNGSAAWRWHEPITEGEITMKMTRVLGLAAVGALLVLATPVKQAQALSLANPATVTAIQEGSKASMTEVRWHRRWHRHWHRRHW
jgi:hypothetical protein